MYLSTAMKLLTSSSGHFLKLWLGLALVPTGTLIPPLISVLTVLNTKSFPNLELHCSTEILLHKKWSQLCQVLLMTSVTVHVHVNVLKNGFLESMFQLDKHLDSLIQLHNAAKNPNITLSVQIFNLECRIIDDWPLFDHLLQSLCLARTGQASDVASFNNAHVSPLIGARRTLRIIPLFSS